MITSMLEMTEDFQKVFEEMFKVVGAPTDIPLTDDWYTTHQWTAEQEEEFHKWFVQYHWKGEGKKGGGVLMRSASTKKACEKGWQYFNLMYGWKVKETK